MIRAVRAELPVAGIRAMVREAYHAGMAAEPSMLLIVGGFFIGLAASVFWPVTRYLITIAHEGGHVVAGAATGGKIVSVTVNADGTGLTKATLKPNRFLFWLVGYVGPSLFGILGATILVNGMDPDVILWLSFALLVLIFFQIRNLFGWFAVIIGGLTFFMVARYGTPIGRTVLAYSWVWFLLIGGFLHTVQSNRKSVGWSADAASLRDFTKLPRGFWGLLWWLATLAALVYGGGILFGEIDPPVGHHAG
jgi:hypothetical protein